MTNDLAGCLSILVIILLVITVGTVAGWLILYLSSFLFPAIQVSLWNGFLLFGILWIVRAIIT